LKRIRRYLVAGILVWLPLGLTFFLLRILIGLMDRSLLLVPAQYRPEVLIGVAIPGLGVILTIVLVFLTGVLAANFIGRRFVGGWEALMNRIPVVRSIYSGAKNFAEIVFSESGTAFKKVLLVEYPRKGIYSLTFQTAAQLGEVQGRLDEDVIACFVPTTPNPTSGFYLLVPEDEVTDANMTVEDAFKLVMSAGLVTPGANGANADEDAPASVSPPADTPPKSVSSG
jgi:uncharacterized membrane protein